jgi:DNA-directed RNA polymerase subunit RPC12/RpoP
MTTYFRTPEMQNGGPFKCFNCGKTLAIKLGGDKLSAEFKCKRCKAYILIKVGEEIPWKLESVNK